MSWIEILKVAGLYPGIFAGFFAIIFVLYFVFMKLVNLFNNSISYNVYRPEIEKKVKPPKDSKNSNS